MLASIQADPTTFLREHCTFPSLPDVVSNLQSLLLNEEVSIDDAADLVNEDPALAAKVLQVVNSVYYCLPQKVSTVQSAASILGLNEIYRIVLALSVIDAIAVTQMDEIKEFWSHSFHCAIYAKYLARRYEPDVPLSILWASAVLHDIGKLVYLKYFPRHYKAIKALCKEHGCLFSEAERFMSLPASGYLGALLCDQWKLPATIRQACGFHTLADLSSTDEDSSLHGLKRVICLANIVTLIALDKVNSQKKGQLQSAMMSALGCSEVEYATILKDVLELGVQAAVFLDDLKSE